MGKNKHHINRWAGKSAEDVLAISQDGVCCYRDATFSPDGTYVLFAFQDIRLGAENPIDLYYLPIGSLEANANFEPIPLPVGFLIGATMSQYLLCAWRENKKTIEIVLT